MTRIILALLVMLAAVGVAKTQPALKNGHTWPISPPHLVYSDAHQNMVFDIAPDGKVTLGDHITPDAASKAFWKAVQQEGLQFNANCKEK